MGALCFIRYFQNRQLKNVRHAPDSRPRCYLFTNEEWENKIVDTELCLTDQVSQAYFLAQPARPVNRVPHESRLSVAPRGRKLAKGLKLLASSLEFSSALEPPTRGVPLAGVRFSRGIASVGCARQDFRQNWAFLLASGLDGVPCTI